MSEEEVRKAADEMIQRHLDVTYKEYGTGAVKLEEAKESSSIYKAHVRHALVTESTRLQSVKGLRIMYSIFSDGSPHCMGTRRLDEIIPEMEKVVAELERRIK